MSAATPRVVVLGMWSYGDVLAFHMSLLGKTLVIARVLRLSAARTAALPIRRYS